MRFGLVVIGDEILSGKRSDAHLPKVIELLRERGMRLDWARYAGDDRAALVHILREALSSGDTVFSCGGIGATPDDHTRQAAAQAAGQALCLHPQAAELITERMREVAQQAGKPFDPEGADHRRRLEMGVFPQHASLIPNPYNRIPGFSLAGQGQGGLHCVPGFPVMAWPMIAWVLDTHCSAWHGAGRQHERALIVHGAAEAVLTPLMEAVQLRFDGVQVFSLPSVDHPTLGRHIELGVKGRLPEQVDLAFEWMRAEAGKLDVALGAELVHTSMFNNGA